MTLGEGFTPLVHARSLWRVARPRSPLHQGRVAQPDQFVQGARGQSAAVTRATYLGAKTIALPTAGNAGNARPPHSAAAGLACEVFIPEDAKRRSSTNAGSTART